MAADANLASRDRFSVPIGRRREAFWLSISLKPVSRPGIARFELVQRVLEEARDEFEALVQKPVFVAFGEGFAHTQIAGSWAGTEAPGWRGVAGAGHGEPLACADASGCFAAARIDFVMSRKASSRSGNFVTGLPSVGDATSLPKGATCQSQGRRITGMTLAAPEL